MALSAHTRGVVEMSLAMTISGTVGWFVVRSGLAPSAAVFWRCLFGAGAMLVVCAMLGVLRAGVPDRRRLGWIVAGGLALALNWSLLFGAYAHASISVATIVYHTQPFMLVGLGALLLAERPTAGGLGWLMLGFAGLVCIVLGRPASDLASPAFLAGVAMALAAAFFYAVAALIAKRLKDVPPHLIVLVQLAVGAVLLSPFAGRPPEAHSWAMLATIGIVHTALMSTLLYGALQKLSTGVVGVLSFVYPAVAVVVDWFAFDQRMQPVQFVGAGAVLVSAAAMNLGAARAGARPGALRRQ